MRTLRGVQHLRGLAAMAVLCFHAAQRSGVRFAVGEAGVDLFFVLSGFLMVAVTAPGTGPLRFLADRARRVAPAYWLAMMVFGAAAAAGLFPNARLDPRHVLASFLFLPARAPGSPETWPLLVPGWTLNLEMFFYALFALSLPLAPRWRLPALTAALVALVALGALADSRGAAARFYTRPILLEFAAGAWLGHRWGRRGAPPGGWAAVAAAAALYVAAWRVGDDTHRFLLYGLPALLLLAGALGVERRGGLPEWRPLGLLGDASYSVYLWHTMALAVTARLARVAGLPGWAAVSLGVAAGVGVGIAAFHAIERPLLGWSKRRRTRPRPPGVRDAPRGFEPRLTESESVVLPLDDGAVRLRV